ncbi:MAG TPA: hypothetical protein EYG55_10440 [Gemmatimonadetes bacterium]|nr:hypothetical protein [Gemmatimonadota bacterium]
MTKFGVILGVVAVLGAGGLMWSVRGSVLGTPATGPLVELDLDDAEVYQELAQGITSGDDSGTIGIIEFGDYQCPGCGGFALAVKPQIDLMLVQTGRAYFQFFDFPLTNMHPHAFLAARAARCAGDQDRYWEYHQELFRNQSSWSGRQSAVGAFLGYAQGLGLDQDTFEGCVKSDKYANVVTANMSLGRDAGVSGTPTIFIMVKGQGLRPVMRNDFQSIEAAIESALEDVETARN